MEFSVNFFFGVLQIVAADLILAGDNALLIGIVIQTLPKSLRYKACLLGTAGALICRVTLGFVALHLLQYQMLRLAGGLLIIWIAMKLAAPDKNTSNFQSPKKLFKAAWIIICADVVMSGDNVLAVAGIARGNFALFVFGIAFSLPLMVFASQGVAWALDRWPYLNLLGAVFLGWIGSQLIADDTLLRHIKMSPMLMHYILGGTAMLIVFLWWYFKNKKDTA